MNANTRFPNIPSLGTPSSRSSMRRMSIAVCMVVESRDVCDAGSPRSAMKYSRPDSRISVSLGAHDGQVPSVGSD